MATPGNILGIIDTAVTGNGFRRDVSVPVGATATSAGVKEIATASIPQRLLLDNSSDEFGLDLTLPGDYDSDSDELVLYITAERVAGSADSTLSVASLLRVRDGASAVVDELSGLTARTVTIGNDSIDVYSMSFSGLGLSPNDALSMLFDFTRGSSSDVAVYGLVFRFRSNIALTTRADR